MLMNINLGMFKHLFRANIILNIIIGPKLHLQEPFLMSSVIYSVEYYNFIMLTV